MIELFGTGSGKVLYTEKVKTGKQIKHRTFTFSIDTKKLISMEEEVFDPLTNTTFPTKKFSVGNEDAVMEYYTPDGYFSITTKDGRKFYINCYVGVMKYYQGSLLFKNGRILTITPALYLDEAEERLENFKLRFCTEKNCKDYKHMYLAIKSRGN